MRVDGDVRLFIDPVGDHFRNRWTCSPRLPRPCNQSRGRSTLLDFGNRSIAAQALKRGTTCPACSTCLGRHPATHSLTHQLASTDDCIVSGYGDQVRAWPGRIARATLLAAVRTARVRSLSANPARLFRALVRASACNTGWLIASKETPGVARCSSWCVHGAPLNQPEVRQAFPLRQRLDRCPPWFRMVPCLLG